MDQLEERVCEEVRKYPHLYDPRSPHHKDSTYSSNSWREIAMNVGLDTAETVKRWKNARDKFVRQRRDLKLKKSGDPGGKKVPAFYMFLSWLDPFIKHRQTSSNFPSEEPSAAATVSESPPPGPSSDAWNPPEDDCLYEAECDADANPSPHPAESTVCGAESTSTSPQTRLQDETQPVSPRSSSSSRPLGPRPWGRRGRRLLGKSGAEESSHFMRSVGRNRERLAAQRDPCDAISAYCRSLEQRMRQMPKHALPYFQHEVDGCLFNYTVEHTLPPRHRAGERYDPKSVSLEADPDHDSDCDVEPRKRRRMEELKSEPDSEEEELRRRRCRKLELEAELEQKRLEVELVHKREELRQEAELSKELDQTCRRLQELRRRREQRRRELQMEVCALERQVEVCVLEQRKGRRRELMEETTQRRELRRGTLDTQTGPLVDSQEWEVEVELDS